MSSKSDSDNRSNQLNPNNAAYHSSRSGNSAADDDESYESSSVGSWAAKQENLRILFGSTNASHKPPLRQTFTFDFVSLCGKVALLEATVEVDQLQFIYRGDCIDVAEYLFEKLRIAFVKEIGSDIALSQLKNSNGSVIGVVGEEFNPSAFIHNKRSIRYLKNAELWETTGKAAVQQLRDQLKDGNLKPREDLGVINSKQLPGYRYRG